MTSIQPKNKDGTNISTTTTTVSLTTEGRASDLKQSREREKKESAAGWQQKDKGRTKIGYKKKINSFFLICRTGDAHHFLNSAMTRHIRNFPQS